MISQLDGACGRLIVASMTNPDVKEAMQMVTRVSIALGDLYYGFDTCEECEECVDYDKPEPPEVD
jgi:hypothetical protein